MNAGSITTADGGLRTETEKPQAEGAAIWFRITDRLNKMYQGLNNLRGDRGPDDYAKDRDDLRDLIRDAARAGSHYGNTHHNGNSTSKGITLLIIGGLVTINVAAIGWFASSLIQLREDVAVIKCQLNPECKQAVSNGRP